MEAAAIGRTGDAGPSALRVAAAVLVFAGLTATQVRMDEEWGRGIFLVLDAVGAVITFGWALQAAGGPVPGAAPRRADGEAPSGATTALLVVGLSFVLSMIVDLADILGAEGGPGAVTWVALLFAGIAGYAGWVLGSPVSALFSSAALGVAFIAFVDWVFDPSSVTTFRWLLLVLAVAYAAAAFRLDKALPRHAVQHVSAAGLALLALLSTFFLALIQPAVEAAFGQGEAGQIDAGLGWEVIGLAGAGAVLAYAVARREPGPGFIGAITLSLAILTAAYPGSDVSLVGWPLLLVIAAVAAVGAVVRTEGVP